jgi:hypothetical protein
LQLTDSEIRKLRVSWLAWKDITATVFRKIFRRLWNQSLRETKSILELCKYEQNILEVGKIGVTLNPEVGFAFSVIPEAYYINVWHLFLLAQKDEAAVFFRPSFLLANELVHEHAHYRFLKEHNVLGVDKQNKMRLISSLGLEDEKFALNEELKFLNKMLWEVPREVEVKFLHIKSWNNKGEASLEGKTAHLLLQENIVQYMSTIETKIKNLNSKEKYDAEMVERGKEHQSLLSSILKLSLGSTSTVWPVVGMKI